MEMRAGDGRGRETGSVIAQGRVDGNVTCKPRGRRMLIEEAAGLGKHRKRRRRAQLKLERTQENLDRALDVEREARSRLRPLKRQAEAAQLHERIGRQVLETRWELTGDDLRLVPPARSEAEAAARRAYAGRSALERVGLRCEQAAAAFEALTARVASREAALAALRADAGTDDGSAENVSRVEALELDLAALEREREADLERE